MGLRRTKAIAAVSAMTLSIGITGTATLFAIVDGIRLKPLPVRDQDRLIVIWRELPTSRGRQWPFRASVVTLLNDASRGTRP